VVVADVAYWNANKLSNDSGAWPVSIESVTKGTKLSRQLVVFSRARADKSSSAMTPTPSA
jgi:hypothetical protein